MPKRRPSRDLDGSFQSIRDEIIDGLQKMGSNVNFLKQGVVKIYEDLKPIPVVAAPTMPTYASPTKKGQIKVEKVKINKDNDDEEEEENPYETMIVKDDTNNTNTLAYDDIQKDFRYTLRH